MDLITTYMEQIDEKYWAMKRKRLHPFKDLSYQKWSARMNRANLKYIANGHPDSTKLKYVHSYWTAKNRLLVLYAESRFTKRKEKRKLQGLCKDLRSFIFDGKPTLGGLIWRKP